MLSAKNLHCRRGGRTVLANLNFELQAGCVLELRGANGSGKTSLLRVLAGLAPASGGELCWNNAPLLVSEHTRRMVYLGHLNALSTELTPLENLHFAQQLSGGIDPAVALDIWGLSVHANQPVRFLSQGQRRRLALARVWVAQRPLWLLDEPCAALDSAGEKLFDTQLSAHLAAGDMAVVATHRALNVPATSLQRIDLDSLSSSAEVAIAAC